MLTAGTAALLIGTMGTVELVLGGTFGWLMLGVSAVLAGLMLVFRHRGDVTVFGHAVVGAAVLGIGALMALSGGRATGGAMILPLLVLLAMLVLPGRQGLWWAGAALAIVLAAFWMVRTGAPAWVAPEPSWVASAGYRVPSALCIVGAAFGMYFMRSYRGVLDGLERSRRREAELLRITTLQKERFTDFAMVAADWFWETDADDRLTHVSPGFGEAFGLSNEEMVGATPVEIARRLLPESVRDSAVDPLAGRADFSGQRLLAISADGERRHPQQQRACAVVARRRISRLPRRRYRHHRAAGVERRTPAHGRHRPVDRAGQPARAGGRHHRIAGWLRLAALHGPGRVQAHQRRPRPRRRRRRAARGRRGVAPLRPGRGPGCTPGRRRVRHPAAQRQAARGRTGGGTRAGGSGAPGCDRPAFRRAGREHRHRPHIARHHPGRCAGQADAACYAAKRSGRHRYVNA